MPSRAASERRFILAVPCIRPQCLEANRACGRRFHDGYVQILPKWNYLGRSAFPFETSHTARQTRKPRTAVGSPNVKHLGDASTGGLAAKRFVIEDIYPTVDGGRFPVKRIAGETIDVWADIFRDGHEVIAAALRWRAKGARS